MCSDGRASTGVWGRESPDQQGVPDRTLQTWRLPALRAPGHGSDGWGWGLQSGWEVGGGTPFPCEGAARWGDVSPPPAFTCTHGHPPRWDLPCERALPPLWASMPKTTDVDPEGSDIPCCPVRRAGFSSPAAQLP